MMEILTSRMDNGEYALTVHKTELDAFDVEYILKKAIDKLAAYEDTGLSPEEIKAMIEPSNNPLTSDELREMNGEPVWVVPLIGSIAGIYESCWCIVRDAYITNGLIPTDSGRFILCLNETSGYGLDWIAYRRKPEEGAK